MPSRETQTEGLRTVDPASQNPHQDLALAAQLISENGLQSGESIGLGESDIPESVLDLLHFADLYNQLGAEAALQSVTKDSGVRVQMLLRRAPTQDGSPRDNLKPPSVPVRVVGILGEQEPGHFQAIALVNFGPDKVFPVPVSLFPGTSGGQPLVATVLRPEARSSFIMGIENIPLIERLFPQKSYGTTTEDGRATRNSPPPEPIPSFERRGISGVIGWRRGVIR